LFVDHDWSHLFSVTPVYFSIELFHDLAMRLPQMRGMEREDNVFGFLSPLLHLPSNGQPINRIVVPVNYITVSLIVVKYILFWHKQQTIDAKKSRQKKN